MYQKRIEARRRAGKVESNTGPDDTSQRKGAGRLPKTRFARIHCRFASFSTFGNSDRTRKEIADVSRVVTNNGLSNPRSSSVHPSVDAFPLTFTRVWWKKRQSTSCCPQTGKSDRTPTRLRSGGIALTSRKPTHGRLDGP